MLIKFNPFFVCCKCGTLLRRWPPTVPESAQRTGRSSHSRTVHPKIGEHHREQSRQPFSGCAGPAIAGTPAQEQRAGRSAAPDSKSMSGSVPLRRLLTFVDKGIVKPKCPRNVTTAKKIHWKSGWNVTTLGHFKISLPFWSVPPTNFCIEFLDR